MKTTISANYLNRRSPKKWLVRQSDELPIEATIARCVVATNVKFELATKVEAELGCSHTAVTDEPVTVHVGGAIDTSGMRRLRYECGNFIPAESVRPCHDGIHSVEKLVLCEDGSIFADFYL
jgi:hypothetical protein